MPGLIEREQLDLVVANGENAAGGSGLTPANLSRADRAPASTASRSATMSIAAAKSSACSRREPNIVKPANFPPEAPGRDLAVVTARNGVPVAVVSLLGRVFMRPVDCPWHAADRVLAAIAAGRRRSILVDFHAEATSDMQLMGRYLDGRVTAVLGTHTHVPTADEQILPGGTAFQCDVGMTGPYESILGRRIDRVMETTLTFNPTAFRRRHRRRPALRHDRRRRSRNRPGHGHPPALRHARRG